MEGDPGVLRGAEPSKVPMLLNFEITRSPPYVGWPSLSHHFPLSAVVGVVVTVDLVVVCVTVVAVVLVVVVLVVGIVVVDEVANTRDMTRKQVMSVQSAALFKLSSYFISQKYRKNDFRHFDSMGRQ
jgi:hypothetical protein